MTTQALPAQGTALKRGNGNSPETFTKIAEVMDITGPQRTRTMVEANSLDTTVEEYITGILKSGTVTLSMILVPGDTGQGGLRSDLDAAVLRNFEIHLTDSPATVIAFAAYVSALTEVQATTDGKLSATATLTISGDVDIS